MASFGTKAVTTFHASSRPSSCLSTNENLEKVKSCDHHASLRGQKSVNTCNHYHLYFFMWKHYAWNVPICSHWNTYALPFSCPRFPSLFSRFSKATPIGKPYTELQGHFCRSGTWNFMSLYCTQHLGTTSLNLCLRSRWRHSATTWLTSAPL